MNAESIIELLALARSHGFEPDLGELQNAVYPYYDGTRKAEADDELSRDCYLSLNFK